MLEQLPAHADVLRRRCHIVIFIHNHTTSTAGNMAKKCLACPGTRSFVCFAVRVHVCDSFDWCVINIVCDSVIFRVIGYTKCVVTQDHFSITICHNRPIFVFNNCIMSCPCLYIVHALTYIVADLFGWRNVLPPVVVTICYDTSTCALYTCLFVIVFFWINVIDHIQHQCMECVSLAYTATLFGCVRTIFYMDVLAIVSLSWIHARSQVGFHHFNLDYYCGPRY